MGADPASSTSRLGALASYKAAWEMVAKPFYWDKTSHGHFDQRSAE